MKKIFLFAVCFSLLALGGCGKYAVPEPYPDSGYPHSYPRN